VAIVDAGKSNVVVVAGLLLVACSGGQEELGLQGQGEGAELRLEPAAREVVDANGKRWLLSKRAVISEHADPVALAAPARAEKSKKEMTVEEIEAAESPIMEAGGFEYRLDPRDARALAKEMKAAAMRDGEESTNGGPPDAAVALPGRVPQAVYGGESRTSVWNNTWPWSMIGWMEDSCTTFKVINQHTAVTSAHCVHTGSSWKPRKRIQFAAPTGIVGFLSASCYDRIVPSCWSGSSSDTDCDRAVFRLHSNTAACNFDNYAVGWFGTRTVGSCLSDLHGALSGYPAKAPEPGAPPGNWAYPLLFSDWRTDGSTSCFTYPTQVWYLNDSSGGQSGGPWWAVFDGQNQVRAINKGNDTGVFFDTNHGRRMTSDLVSWIQSNAGF
jgi:V8-like Glu-specific endopeptidase